MTRQTMRDHAPRLIAKGVFKPARNANLRGFTLVRDGEIHRLAPIVLTDRRL